MASLAPECTELKQKYETCFNKWYSEKFLKGDLGSDCQELFKLYRSCLVNALQSKNLDKMISDAQKDRPLSTAGSDSANE